MTATTATKTESEITALIERSREWEMKRVLLARKMLGSACRSMPNWHHGTLSNQVYVAAVQELDAQYEDIMHMRDGRCTVFSEAEIAAAAK